MQTTTITENDSPCEAEGCELPTRLACNSCHRDLCGDHLNDFSGNCAPCHAAIVKQQRS